MLEATVHEEGTLEAPWRPKGGPREENGAQREPKGRPKGGKMTPKGMQKGGQKTEEKKEAKWSKNGPTLVPAVASERKEGGPSRY